MVDEMGGGFSKARVLRVYMTAGASKKTWVQPYFVKIDRPEKIKIEAGNYDAASDLIPFWLRPNISRTVYGADRAVMVGNLVDKSESLWDVVRRGQGEEAIFNLFNSSLGAFRGLGLQTEPVVGSIASALEDARVIQFDRVKADNGTKEKGLKAVAELKADLFKLEQCYSAGTIHGDLHAENVRVRGNDAILIDLQAMKQNAPLVADLALLETWIAFAVHREDTTEEYSDLGWASAAESLYAPATFLRAPEPPDAPTTWNWMAKSVRNIRAIALADQRCKSEYITAVVVALLRRCMFPPTTPCDEFRKATAYSIACRLTAAIQSW